MAVPKKKTSKSRRDQRRSHDALTATNTVVDSATGNIKRPHRMDLETGFYKGRIVKPPKNKANLNQSEE